MQPINLSSRCNGARPRRALALALALACLTVGLTANAATDAARLTFLHTRGHDIVDESGRKVLLRGVGLGNWMLPEGYMWKFGNRGDRPRRIEKIVSDLIGPVEAQRFWTQFRQNYITEADIQRIAKLGFNSVRPALNARLFLTEAGKPDAHSEGFLLLDNLVKWCGANGIYVIIDMHGAPGGQTGQNIDDSANDLPELFMHAQYQDQLVALWTAIAERYHDKPAVAGYDLLNEPLPARTGAAAQYKAQLEPLYRRITKAIRAVDARHMIILEGVDWANDWSVFTGPFDANLVYQFHYYCWDTPARLKDIDRFLAYRTRFNTPVWVGETGERDNAIYWATTEYFEANNIGWSFWPWKKLDTANAPCSIKRPADWDAVAEYSNGGARPDTKVARRAFAELLENIALACCVYHADVVNAMLRRVPARIEAENFGQQGPQVSYVVSNNSRRSEFYRPGEPVMIKTSTARRPQSAQYISLQPDEWTAYQINNDTPRTCQVTLRVRAESAPAAARLQINDQAFDVKIRATEWTDIKVGTVALPTGPCRVQWRVEQGAVDFDWLDLSDAAEPTAKVDSVKAPSGS